MIGEDKVIIPELASDILERISFVARESELVDEKSGVSARLSISSLENLVSSAERRMLINGEEKTTIRLSDFWGVIPAITGKVELVYEGEQEGPRSVALILIGKAIKQEFLTTFQNPDRLKKETDVDIFEDIRNWFGQGNALELYHDDPDATYRTKLKKVPGLEALAKRVTKDPQTIGIAAELILHALAEFNILNKDLIDDKLTFSDMLANMLDDLD